MTWLPGRDDCNSLIRYRMLRLVDLALENQVYIWRHQKTSCDNWRSCWKIPPLGLKAEMLK